MKATHRLNCLAVGLIAMSLTIVATAQEATRRTVQFALDSPQSPQVEANRAEQEISVVEMSRRLQAVYASVSPSLVRLATAPPQREFPLGCGVIVSEDGLLVTPLLLDGLDDSDIYGRPDAHCKVYLSDGRETTALLLGWSKEWRIGMAKLDAPGPWRFVTLAADDEPKERRHCVVLDYPNAYGLGFDPAPMLRFGAVTTVSDRSWFATSCGIPDRNPGQNLGCGVFDLDGRLLGITSSLRGRSEPVQTHAAVVRRLWDDLAAGKNLDRERLFPEGRKLSEKFRDTDSTPALSPPQADGPIFTRARAATVRIRTHDNLRDWSGVIVSEDGLIATCGQDRVPTGQEVTVLLPDGRDLHGKMLGSNWVSDAGLVRITELGRWPFVEIGNSTGLHAGDECVLMGFPRGYKERKPFLHHAKVTEVDGGAWSSVLTVDELAATAGGDPGGGVFDARGRLVAVIVGRRGHLRIEVLRAQWDDLLKVSAMTSVPRDVSLHALNREVSRRAGKALATVVEVRNEKKRLALGMIVGAKGSILTKASELEGPIQCRLADGRTLPATVQRTNQADDLALLKVDAADLPVVEWAGSYQPAPGSIVGVVIPGRDLAIDAVAYPVRSVNREGGHFRLLNDSLKETAAGLTLVDDKIVGMGESPFRVGDVVKAINGRAVPFLNTFRELVAASLGAAGDRIRITIQRGDETLQLSVSLAGTWGPRPLDESRRSSGFSRAFDLALPLVPNDCGGPIINVEGQIVGMTIGRKSSERVYSLPVDVIRKFLEKAVER